MNHSELVKALIKPGADILATLTPEKINLLHMAVGISGEVGELIEGQVGLEEPDMANFIEEMGDLEFYFEGVCQQLTMVAPDIEMPESDDPFVNIVMQAANILDAVKKHVIYNQELDVHRVFEQMTALRFSMTELYVMFGTTRDLALEENQVKLTTRYGDKYSDNAAHRRADKEGGYDA